MKLHLYENTDYADDGANGDINIGCVEAPRTLGLDAATELIHNAWIEFQKTEPNSDDEFRGFLMVEHGFKPCKDGEVLYVN